VALVSALGSFGGCLEETGEEIGGDFDDEGGPCAGVGGGGDELDECEVEVDAQVTAVGYKNLGKQH
jgi:hypothetical protein